MSTDQDDDTGLKGNYGRITYPESTHYINADTIINRFFFYRKKSSSSNERLERWNRATMKTKAEEMASASPLLSLTICYDLASSSGLADNILMLSFPLDDSMQANSSKDKKIMQDITSPSHTRLRSRTLAHTRLTSIFSSNTTTLWALSTTPTKGITHKAQFYSCSKQIAFFPKCTSNTFHARHSSLFRPITNITWWR